MNKTYLLVAALITAAALGARSALFESANATHTEPPPAQPKPTASHDFSMPAQPTTTPGIKNEIVLSAPSVTRPRFNLLITSPTAGQQFVQGTEIEHRAQATDPLEGDISHKIEWRDGQNRLLAKGSAFKLIRGEGQHAVTASVMGSRGQITSSGISYLITNRQNLIDSTDHQTEKNTANRDVAPDHSQTEKPAHFGANKPIEQGSSTNAAADSNNNKINMTWIPYDGVSGLKADFDTEATAGAASGSGKSKKTNSNKKQEKPNEPAPVAEDTQLEIPVCGEPIQIDLTSLITSTADSEIDWSSIAWVLPAESNSLKTESDPKKPGIFNISYAGKLATPYTIRFSVADQQKRRSNQSTITLNTPAKNYILFEGFEKPVVPKDDLHTHKWGFFLSKSTDDPTTFIESNWHFLDGGSEGAGVVWKYDKQPLNAPEGEQTLFLNHNGTDGVEHGITLEKGKTYKVSFYAARATSTEFHSGNIGRLIYIKIKNGENKKQIGHPIFINPSTSGKVTFERYVTNSDFQNESSENQKLELSSAFVNKSFTAITFVDSVCIFQVDP